MRRLLLGLKFVDAVVIASIFEPKESKSRTESHLSELQRLVTHFLSGFVQRKSHCHNAPSAKAYPNLHINPVGYLSTHPQHVLAEHASLPFVDGVLDSRRQQAVAAIYLELEHPPS